MIKFIISIICGILAIIFIWQNAQIVEFSFLAWSVSMSASILFIVILLVGFLLGWGLGSMRKRRKK